MPTALQSIKFILLLSMFFFSINVLGQEKFNFNPTDPHHKLYIPEGNNKHPAILMLHASAGIETVNFHWAELLRKKGYYVFIIDSFTPRGYIDRKSIGWDAATAAQFSDIAPAFNYLTTFSSIDKNRIGILGFSMGGFDVLRAMQSEIPFKAAASFYGVCKKINSNISLKGPLHIFIGQEDDRATTSACEKLISENKSRGSNLLFINTYSNALHGFDNPALGKVKELEDEQGEKYHVGYNETAQLTAEKDLIKFFNKYLNNKSNKKK